MSRTTNKSSPELSIVLDKDYVDYRPGDIVRGHVLRELHVVCPRATINISLHGRTKTKVKQESREMPHSGGANLIDDRRHSQELLDGPLHIPKESKTPQRWRFAITIPTHDDAPSSMTRREAPRVLPPSFEGLSSHGLSGSKEAFVEYYLRAELRLQSQEAWQKTDIARQTIRIGHTSPKPPIAYKKAKPIETNVVVSSLRLLPGMAEQKLTAGQKLKTVFGSSSIPRFSFFVDVRFPTTIQLDNENPISFEIRGRPRWDCTSERIYGVEQKLTMTDITLEIETRVEINCSGYKTSWYLTGDFRANRVLKSLGSELEIPLNDKFPAVDIGEMANLQIKQQSSLACLFPSVRPRFETYDISVSHRLKWAVHLKVAGESTIGRGAEYIRVLPPSMAARKEKEESWIQTPPEGDEPPPFEDLEKELPVENALLDIKNPQKDS